MADNGLQTPLMAEEKALTLKTILGNMGYHEAVKDLMGTERQTRVSQYPDETGARAQHPEFQQDSTQRPSSQPIDLEESRRIDNYGSPWDSYDAWLPENTCQQLASQRSPLTDDYDVGLLSASQNATLPMLEDFAGTSNGNTAGNEESHESLIDELSHRVGTLTIGRAGRTKLHGPSAILNVGEPSVPGAPTQHTTTANCVLSSTGHTCSALQVPEKLEEQLVNHFFNYENPFSHVVDRSMYEKAKAEDQGGEDTAYYSKALVYAM